MKQTLFSSMIIMVLSLTVVPAMSQTILPTCTNVHASSADFKTDIRLKAGRLVDALKVKDTAVLQRFVKADLALDVSLSDANIAEVYSKDAADLVTLFKDMQKALQATGAEVWGVHLPYKTASKSLLDDSNSTKRANAVAYENKLIDLCVQYLNPKVIVTHPGNSSSYPNGYTDITSTSEGHYYNCRKWSRESLVKMQIQIEKSNAAYGGNAILCVENCMRQTTHDALALLDYLDYPGLEKVKVCLDTGHALVPHNSHYLDIAKVKSGASTKTAVQEGDVISMLRLLGDKLGTLHIQQNHGLIGRASSSTTADTHLEPFTGGLIDWGEFYYVLLKEIGYRGCFLYETFYISSYGGSSATIETTAINYKDVILPAYAEYLDQHPETK